MENQHEDQAVAPKIEKVEIKNQNENPYLITVEQPIEVKDQE